MPNFQVYPIAPPSLALRKATTQLGGGANGQPTTYPLTPQTLFTGCPLNFVPDRKARYFYFYDPTNGIRVGDAQNTGVGLVSFLTASAIGHTINCMDVGVLTDPAIYATTTDNKLIRIDTGTKAVTVVAGGGTAATTDGTGASASLNAPFGFAVDLTGDHAFIYEGTSGAMRKIVLATGVVTTTATGLGGTPSYTFTIDKQGNLCTGVAEYALRISPYTGYGFPGTTGGVNVPGKYVPWTCVDTAEPAPANIYYTAQNTSSLMRYTLATGANVAIAPVANGNVQQVSCWMYFRQAVLMVDAAGNCLRYAG